MHDLFTLADKLRKLREERDAQNQLLSDLNAKVETAENELSDAMALAECSSFTRGDKQFIMTLTKRWSVEPDRKDDLYDKLKQNGYERLFTVNAKTLSSFIREQVDATADDTGETRVPDWLSGLVKSYDDFGITMKSAKKTRMEKSS